MKTRYCVCLILAACAMQIASAESPAAADIRQSCKDHSIEVIRTIYKEILPDMSESQIKSALAVANQSCHKHFATPLAVSAAPEKQAAVEPEAETTGTDWFTRYMLEGNPHEKEGVKRLKNRRR